MEGMSAMFAYGREGRNRVVSFLGWASSSVRAVVNRCLIEVEGSATMVSRKRAPGRPQPRRSLGLPSYTRVALLDTESPLLNARSRVGNILYKGRSPLHGEYAAQYEVPDREHMT
jgi:hypothetical protein